MPHRTEESQTGGTDLTATLNWDVTFVEASRVFLTPFWWYMLADTTASAESSLVPITATYVHACKLCLKVDQAITNREAPRY